MGWGVGDAGSAMRGDGMQWDACWCPALGRGFLGEESGRNLALRHCFGDFFLWEPAVVLRR